MAKFDKETAAQAGKRSSRKGTPNRANADLRKVVTDLVEGNIEAILQDMDKLEPKDKINAWLRLLEFCIPKMNRVLNEVTGPNGQALETIIKFVDDSADDTYFERHSAPAAHQAPVERPTPAPLPPLPPIRRKSESEDTGESGIYWR